MEFEKYMEGNLSTEFIEGLLYQSECNYLDFKRDQYTFGSRTPEEKQKKSELLKDILAFVNAWRQEEAYILIGVQEEQGKRHTVIGLEFEDPFDDAHIQQFINGKTNKPIFLRYEIHTIEEKKIGIIRIPKQERPFYSERDFGIVKKEVVYYRQGSSTAEANPKEIANMVKYDTKINEVYEPVIKVQFADPESRSKLGTSINLESIIFQERQTELRDAISRDESGDLRLNISLEHVNENYWRELDQYIRFLGFLKPVSLVIENQSSILAKNVHIEINGDNIDQSNIICERPEKPKEKIFHLTRPSNEGIKEPSISIQRYNNGWLLNVKIGDVKPKQTVWTDDFYIGSKENKTLTLDVKVYGNNLGQPQEFSLTINFDVKTYPSLTIEQLREFYKVDDSIY